MFWGGSFAFEIFRDAGKLYACLSVQTKKAKDFNMGSETLVNLILPFKLIETGKNNPSKQQIESKSFFINALVIY